MRKAHVWALKQQSHFLLFGQYFLPVPVPVPNEYILIPFFLLSITFYLMAISFSSLSLTLLYVMILLFMFLSEVRVRVIWRNCIQKLAISISFWRPMKGMNNNINSFFFIVLWFTIHRIPYLLFQSLKSSPKFRRACMKCEPGSNVPISFSPFRDFNRLHSRPVMSYDDIQPVANEYIRYKVCKTVCVCKCVFVCFHLIRSLCPVRSFYQLWSPSSNKINSALCFSLLYLISFDRNSNLY